jgi:nucleolar protein 14
MWGARGRARERAIQKREKTLLVEYAASKKDNSFKDSRFGEDDPSMPLEEKMLMRFQKERQRQARKSGSKMFLLNDRDDEQDQDGGFVLTHKGKLLGEEDFDEAVESSDEEPGQLGAAVVKVGRLPLGTRLRVCLVA